jgi:peptidoglycan-associated lipoprotein
MKNYLFVLILLFSLGSSNTLLAQVKKDKEFRADAMFASGGFYEAIDLYKNAYNKARDRNKKDEIVFKIAECYRIIGESRQAEIWYKKVITRNFQDPIIYLRYGEMLMMRDNYGEAAEQFKKYKDLVPDDPRGETGLRSSQIAAQWIENPTNYVVEEMRPFNSKLRDFAPAYTEADYNTVIFTSTREAAKGKEKHSATGESFTDIFMVMMDRKEKWSVPVPIGGELSSEADDGTPNVSHDFSTLYFTRCPKGKNEKLGCQIFMSTKSGLEWSKPNIIKLAEDSLVVAHPAISPDNLSLYFVSDFPGGYGGKDIWVVTRENEGADWSAPVNLGEDINTAGDEMFPYVHADGSLYFSSNGHIGLGGLDIYKAIKEPNQRWTVENMRPPINSSADDFGIVFEHEAERGYFSSSRKGRGNDEIYAFHLPPLKFNITGIVRDEKTNRVLPGASVKSIGSDGLTVEAITTGEGSFRFILNPNTDYVFVGSMPGFLNGRERETTKGLEKSTDFNTVIYLSPIDQVIELPNIFYDYAKWDLRPESMVSLDKLVETLNDNPGITIELMSHTDSRGSAEDNIVLSQKRAQSVVDYLVTKGIDITRLTARGYGESTPKKVDEKTIQDFDFLPKDQILTEEYINSLPGVEKQEKAHQVNRRTEFRVIRTDYVPR